MFDIGWSEMAVIALIALIVIGPKDLPNTMKTIAHWMRKAKSLTREFQSGIDDMVREAELEDAKKALDATRGGNLQRTIANAIDPADEVGKEVRSVEQEAQRRDKSGTGTRSDETAGEDGNAGRAAAKMPSPNIAPPHSLTPPAAEAGASGGGDDKPASASGDEGSKKTA